jgi:hypothetical protein
MHAGREIHGPLIGLFFLFFDLNYLSTFEVTTIGAHTVWHTKLATVTTNNKVRSVQRIV